MIKVAIVEDDVSYAEKLEGYLKRYGEEHGVEFQAEIFRDGLLFLNAYKSDYGIVFMDIEMPMMDGLKASQKIRELDSEVILIFVTNLGQHAVKGYAVQAFDFLVKPVNYNFFMLTVKRALTILEQRKCSEVLLRTANNAKRVAVADIKYIEVLKHRLLYHTNREVITIWGNLKEAESQLPGRQFVRCNSGYLVNLQYVKAVEGNDVLVGEEWLQISRAKKKAFLDALTEYIGG